MTLLTICRDVADELNLPRPATVVGNADTNAQKMLRYANKVGTALMRDVPWQALRSEQTFTSLASETQTGILPAGFDRFIPETFWDRSAKTLISGPVTPSEWAGLKAVGYSDTENRKFALRGSNVLIQPTIGAGASLAFEYIKNTWALAASGGAPQTGYLADGDTTVFSEELITAGMVFVFLDGIGQPSSMALATFQRMLDTLAENDQARADVAVAGDIFGGGRHFTGIPPV
jgi:hypothetical protein